MRSETSDLLVGHQRENFWDFQHRNYSFFRNRFTNLLLLARSGWHSLVFALGAFAILAIVSACSALACFRILLLFLPVVGMLTSTPSESIHCYSLVPCALLLVVCICPAHVCSNHTCHPLISCLSRFFHLNRFRLFSFLSVCCLQFPRVHIVLSFVPSLYALDSLGNFHHAHLC